ncbi:hypothetical protein [Rickettsia fournieri]|uniref:hypothetical protein n=1 Tax=Rickettsia fournieri TaxID=1436798 RepID=UPI001FD746B9|nr:hypothetical protein [Rickettsia fournieri]
MHNLTAEEYDAYIRAKLMEDAEEIALDEQCEKGKAEISIEIAKNLLLKDIDVNIIADSTGLTIEEIEELKAKIENSETS